MKQFDSCEWERALQNLPVCSHFSAIVANDHYLYVIGGRRSWGILNDVQYAPFDPD